jgi:predicted amidohydrolase YtcJ
MYKIIRACLMWMTVSLAASAAPAGAGAPDTILFNGKIFTSAQSQLYVQALAVQGDRIEAVGDSEQIKRLAGPRTKLIDLDGRTVIPGLNDAHNHLGISPAGTVRLHFGNGDPAWSDAEPVIAAAERKSSPDAILVGVIGPSLFKDVHVNRKELDRVAPTHPVILTTFTGHACILNSAALHHLGIPEDQQDFPGARFERGADGKLTGVLREYARFIVRRRLAEQTTDEDGVKQLRNDLSEALLFGITTIQDMANVIPPDRAVRLLEQTQVPIRVRVMRMPLASSAGRNLSEGQNMPKSVGDYIRVSGTKWMLDGTPLEGTYAARTDDSPPDMLIVHLGMTFPSDEMKKMLSESLLSGDQVLFHVSGYPAAKALLKAMADTGGSVEWVKRRVRMEHGDGLLPDLRTQAKELGVVVVQNPQHFVGLPPRLVKRIGAQPLKSLLRAGIPVALGSDDEMNPYLDIMLAASHPNNPPEAITREQAVLAYTLTSAFAEFAEKDKGELQPEKLADLAVLSQDIFTVPMRELPKTRSVMTMVGGRIVYDAKLLH